MSIIVIAFLTVLGFLIGILGGMIGIGGAILSIPALLYVYPAIFPMVPRLSMVDITDITAMQSLAAGVAAVRVHWRHENLDIKLILMVGLWSMVGGYLGGLSTDWYSDHLLKVVFACLMAIVAVTLLKKHLSLKSTVLDSEGRPMENGAFETDPDDMTLKQADAGTDVPVAVATMPKEKLLQPQLASASGVSLTGMTHKAPIAYAPNRPNQILISIAAVATGYLAGILGVGGAIFVMPIFSNWLRLPVRMAIGNTTGVIAMTCLASLFGKVQMSSFPWLEAGLISLGALLGANLGAKFSFRVKESALLLLFLSIVTLTLLRVSIELIWGH